MRAALRYALEAASELSGALLAVILPRRVLQIALYCQWKDSLTHSDRARLNYWGATGNEAHHPFAWADKLPPKETL